MNNSTLEAINVAANAGTRKPMSRRKKAVLAVKALLTLALLAYIFIYRFDVERFRADLAAMNGFWLLAGVGIGVTFNILKFIKWHYLLNARGVPATFFEAFASYAVGNSVGIATPGRAGELARALYFPPEKRKPVWGLIVYDRVLDVAASALIAIPGAFFLTDNIYFGICVAGLAILLLTLSFHSGWLSWVWSVVRRKSDDRMNLHDMVSRPQALFAFALSLLAFSLILVEMYCFINAFENINLMGSALGMPLVIISNLIPITVFGLGVREGVAQWSFGHFGVGKEIAGTCAFLIFVVNTLLLAIVGVLFIGKLRIARNGQGEGTRKPLTEPESPTHEDR